MTDPKRAEAPDFGEPWTEGRECVFDAQGRAVLGHMEGKTRYHLTRARLCVNACAGMADPAKEIEAMRERHPAREKAVRDLRKSVCMAIDALDSDAIASAEGGLQEALIAFDAAHMEALGITEQDIAETMPDPER